MIPPSRKTARALQAAALLGLLAASGGLDHIDPEEGRLGALRADLRRLLRNDPKQLERVLAWAGERPDMAEEAYRRICRGWCLAPDGEWRPPPPAPPIEPGAVVVVPPSASAPDPVVIPGRAESAGRWEVHGPRRLVQRATSRGQRTPNKTREEERRGRQAKARGARRGGVS